MRLDTGNSQRVKHGRSRNEMNPSYVSPQCIVLIGILAVILGIVNLVPDSVTQLLRPFFIAVCLILPSYGFYRIGNFRWLIILIIYYLIIFLAFPQTRNAFTVFVSLETFALFFFFAGSKVWTAREVSLIIKMVCLACAFEAAVILYSNPGLLRNSSSQHISYFSATLNRNPAAFSITPGALCGMILMFYDHSKKHIFLFFVYAAITFVCAFAVFSLGCRSAFFSMAIGAFLIAWDAVSRDKNASSKANKRIALIAVSFIILYLTAHYASGSYSARLFEFGEEMNDSGRHDIWVKVWDYILMHPVFGGGYDNFPSDLGMGTHNSFLTIMLYSGMVGGGLMAVVMASFLLESLRTRNVVAVAMMTQAAFHSYTEPSFDYYAYIPLCLSVILLRYLENQSRDIHSIFLPKRGRQY